MIGLSRNSIINVYLIQGSRSDFLYNKAVLIYCHFVIIYLSRRRRINISQNKQLGSQNRTFTRVPRAMLRHVQVLLRLAQACSGSAPACSPSAQVKAAVAHVRRLKRNKRKGKSILSLRVFGWHFEDILIAFRYTASIPSHSRFIHSLPFI